MLIADLPTFVGRLHPLVVHLPIGALLLALLLDLAGYKIDRDQFKTAIKISLLIGFLSAIVACLFGYLLSLSGSYEADALDRHMYSGIGLVVVSGILYLIVVPPKIFSVLLLSMTALVAFTGHQGGSLTYGPDYFSKVGKVEIVAEPIDVEIDSLDLQLIEALRSKGVMVRVMLKSPLMLDVTITSESHYDGGDFVALASRIILFNAADNNLKDDDLTFLKAFVNLEKLRLEKNPLSDAVVDNLLGLNHLVAVNLNETKITAAGVKKLRTNPSVQRVYTWHTKAE